MSPLDVTFSFRARLLIVLAALLVVTLGAQYYLNRRAEKSNERIIAENARIIAEQERALADGITLALETIKSGDYMFQLQEQNPKLLEKLANRVENILVVEEKNGEWRVRDSLKEEYAPVSRQGVDEYVKLCDIEIPPLIDIGHFEEKGSNLPCVSTSLEVQAGQRRAFSIPLQTSNGTRHIIVILGSTSVSGTELSWQTSRPLMVTFGILLVATVITVLLVWPFTTPIKSLADAARRVAAGDLSFRVPVSKRRDEMGMLSNLFNEMIERLGQTRELESRLNQAERSAVIGRLASAIAHEIRNPLNYINLTLDHMRTSLSPEDAKKREIFERLTVQLKEEVARINRHITDFLKYSRPSKLELHPIDPVATIEDSLRLVQMQADEHGIKTSIEKNSKSPTILGDTESLRSVFTNLIINAMQAIDGKGGEVRVKIGDEHDHVRIDLIDTGPGISPEHLPQIFEPYFSTKETGTGLGLAIVKKAIDEHNGTISVKSNLGEGTTFTILLPKIKIDDKERRDMS
jgi:signal transduction histidine kinase